LEADDHQCKVFLSVKSMAAFVIRLRSQPSVNTDPSYLFLCRAKEKDVQLPGYHFVDHCIEILNHDKDYNKVKLHEYAVAHSGLPPKAK